MADDPDVATLIRRIDELESRLAIAGLIDAYTHAFDREDREMMASIWHEDALFDLGEAFGCYRGIDEILKGAEGFWTGLEWMHHWSPNALITLAGDSASSVVNLDCMVKNAEGPAMIAGNYFDRFERRDGRWKFAERKFVMDYWTTLKDWTPTQGLQH